MTREAKPGVARGVAISLAVGGFLMVSLMAWFGFRATREWQRSAALLVERRAGETADLAATALARDMRGVQQAILMTLRPDQIALDPPSDITGLVASAFARYPYPEAFFGWGATEIPRVTFFTRASRPPPWLSHEEAPGRFPVTIVHDPPIVREIAGRILADVEKRRAFSIFETRVGPDAYQVVARLFYRDPLRDELDRVFGFLVNQAWVRRWYFAELTRQIAKIEGASEGLALAVLDDRGDAVVGERSATAGEVRRLAPFFFDPLLVAVDPPPDLSRAQWTVQVSASSDPTLVTAAQAARRTLFLTAASAIVMVIGLALTLRAVRVHAELAEMRSDFVSTVTHELKTPLSTITAVGQTLVRGRLDGREVLHEYAQVLVQESKRLTRLVDNLLAYSRITDVSEAYSFEPLSPADLLADALHGFRVQFADGRFDVQVDAPPALPAVWADRSAMRLVLDNLIDNAIRYSSETRRIHLRAAPEGSTVRIEIRDSGAGIPAGEIEKVQRRFVRGREARSGGSGLGLAIVRRIVRDHGGVVTLQSEIGVGTTVGFSLPVAGGPVAELKAG
jgi:signal transduction histidine kinase